MSNSGRVLLVPEGSLKGPGACAMCGSTRSLSGFADPQIWYDFVGNVYFCESCVNAMIAVFGGSTHGETKTLKQRLINYKDKVLEQASTIRNLEADNAALRRVSRMDVSRAAHPSNGGPRPVDALLDEGLTEDSSGSADDVIIPRVDDPEPTEPVKGKRPRNVSALTNNDFTATLGI